MKTFILYNPRSILLGGLMLFVSNLGWSQTTSDIAKGSNTVKVIDNKGTIKFLQSSNGITTLTNTTTDVTTTTWQLGGSLDDDVNITTGAQEFKLTLNDGTNQGTFVIAGIETAASTSGYTLLVRETSTGEVQQLTTTDLVQSGYTKDTADSTEEANNEIVITSTGIPALSGNEGKISVYRNGTKLLHSTDFSVDASAGTTTVTGTSDFSIITGDVFEVQFVK